MIDGNGKVKGWDRIASLLFGRTPARPHSDAATNNKAREMRRALIKAGITEPDGDPPLEGRESPDARRR